MQCDPCNKLIQAQPSSHADTRLCPACGALNQCSLAVPGSATQNCWCFEVSIDPSVLQALPMELRDTSCLCPRCAGIEAQLQAAKDRPSR